MCFRVFLCVAPHRPKANSMHFGIEIKKCFKFFVYKKFEKIFLKFQNNSEIFGIKNFRVSEISEHLLISIPKCKMYRIKF